MGVDLSTEAAELVDDLSGAKITLNFLHELLNSQFDQLT